MEKPRAPARRRVPSKAASARKIGEMTSLVPAAGSGKDPAISPPALENLRRLESRWREREQGSAGGLRVLFTGPHGTGKTIAAAMLAASLKLDLYRIDLSAVVGKSIGETEKNLARAFDAVEEAGAILLFDEADALFGRRTDVRDSHDRYANLETGFLLQRLASFGGIVIVTTNQRADIEPALARAMDAVVDFDRPDGVPGARAKPIESMGTSTAGFAGATRDGTAGLAPELVTSLADFERIYGGGQQLDVDGGPVDNYLWHGVRAFFENGGRRAYVARVDHPKVDDAASLDAWKSALEALEAIDEVSIVAAPGSSRSAATALPVARELISHAEAMRVRIAILDPMPKQSVSEMLAMRGAVDSSHAALYYPWITIFDPVTQREIDVPPSGAVAGIYARTDSIRGVDKAPANEVVRGAVGLEVLIGGAKQEILNPAGVNCLRFFPGHGYRVWGARTTSSDPEWKYVNVRRYFAYLEHSIDKGTQWAVFEPNGEPLWREIANGISDFLFTEWRGGRLLGDTPETAFFVRCDRTTMTRQDLDAGRVVVMIGVAPVRPAEFVILRIAQWTAGSEPRHDSTAPAR